MITPPRNVFSNPGGKHGRFRLLAAAVVISGYVGCSLPPSSAPWKQDQTAIRPESKSAEEFRVKGRLVVETAETGTPENGRIPHAPYYVFDAQGRFLDRFPNEFLVPVGLLPGRYVVVSRLPGAYRRVQVEVQEGQITYVSLKDFKSAPAAE